MTITELEPKVVFKNFYGITRQPRPSKHEEKIRKYLLEWASKHNVEAVTDETGNVIMRVPATPGFENLKGVILQGHMDMVPQKNADIKHNFEKDPIETIVDGDWLKAKGTTLGADNGLGIALALSIFESPEIKHGPLELLVTYDEETGMTGAKALKSGLLNGDILINLDSETEGELYVGCAGGLDATSTGKYKSISKPDGYKCFTLAVKGFKGGHSGMDIILCRANANKIAARVIYSLIKDADIKLIDMEGGTLRNAIPRECFASMYIAEDKIAVAKKTISTIFEEVKSEYAATDPDCLIELKPCSKTVETEYINDRAALKYMRAIIACPDGVERMSDQMPGMVETSNNMAMVKIGNGKFAVNCLLRSSVESAKQQLAVKIESVFSLSGVKTSFSGGYSGWAPNASSEILRIMKNVYADMFGKEPAVMAIHAGLECGILSGEYPNWDMVSCGPTLLSPHSPDERAFIPSVQKVWDFLKAVLVSIPEK